MVGTLSVGTLSVVAVVVVEEVVVEEVVVVLVVLVVIVVIVGVVVGTLSVGTLSVETPTSPASELLSVVSTALASPICPPDGTCRGFGKASDRVKASQRQS